MRQVLQKCLFLGINWQPNKTLIKIQWELASHKFQLLSSKANLRHYFDWFEFFISFLDLSYFCLRTQVRSLKENIEKSCFSLNQKSLLQHKLFKITFHYKNRARATNYSEKILFCFTADPLGMLWACFKPSTKNFQLFIAVFIRNSLFWTVRRATNNKIIMDCN